MDDFRKGRRGVTSNPSFERNDLHRVLTVCCPLETFARRYILRDIYLLVGREWKVVFEAVRIRIDSYCGAGKKKKRKRKDRYIIVDAVIVEIMKVGR